MLNQGGQNLKLDRKELINLAVFPLIQDLTHWQVPPGDDVNSLLERLLEKHRKSNSPQMSVSGSPEKQYVSLSIYRCRYDIDIDSFNFKISTDLNVWHFKNTFTATSRLTFDQTTGSHSPVKLTHRINHHDEQS